MTERVQPGIVSQVLEAIRGVSYGDEDTAAGAVDESCADIFELWRWQRALAGLGRARWQLKEATEKAMIRELKGDAIRLDDAICFVQAAPTEMRVKDSDGLVEYLELSLGAMAVFRSHDISITGLRRFATERGDNPDEVVERFFEWADVEGPPELKIRSMEHAPFWALNLKPGERMAVPDRSERKTT